MISWALQGSAARREYNSHLPLQSHGTLTLLPHTVGYTFKSVSLTKSSGGGVPQAWAAPLNTQPFTQHGFLCMDAFYSLGDVFPRTTHLL